jgi:hypothetical protein
VKEVSVILRNQLLITIEEFKILDNYAHSGKIWTLIHRPDYINSTLITERTVEYIFDPEALTFFKIVSTNILAHWDTLQTLNLKPNEEYNIKDSLFIRQYYKYH